MPHIPNEIDEIPRTLTAHHLINFLGSRKQRDKPFDHIVGAFRECGFVCIRNALPRESMARYLDTVKRYFDCAEARLAASGAAPGDVTGDAISGLPLRPDIEKHPQAPVGIAEILHLLESSGVVDCARLAFESELFVLLDYSSVRRQLPEDHAKALPFHQDGAAVGDEGDPNRGLVFWVPLTPVDADTPGLEIVGYKFGKNLAHRAVSEGYNLLADGAAIEIDYAHRMVPVSDMDVGDVPIFSFDTVHRTRLLPGMSRTRYSLDIRAAPILRVPWH